MAHKTEIGKQEMNVPERQQLTAEQMQGAMQNTTEPVTKAIIDTDLSTPKYNAEVDSVGIQDIYGKLLKYVVIRTAKGKVIISVGDKTFNNVKQIL